MSWQSLMSGKVQRINESDFYVESYKPGAERLYCAFRKINDAGGVEKLSDWLPYRGMTDWLDGYGAGKERRGGER